MNKRNTKTTKLIKRFRSIIFKNPDKFEPTKTIFIVKYNEVYHKPDSKITTNNTYNLFAFEDLSLAKECMDDAYKSFVMPYILSENFKFMFDKEGNIQPKESDTVLYKRSTKIIGDNDRHRSQTILFIFTVETINFKPKS